MNAPTAGSERRQLTVLFCDLVGSTELSMELDVEDYQSLLATYQKAVGAVVEQFDGVVAQLLGDGILAYFGHPMAREDDAERAVRAGLAIVEAVRELDISLQVRVGVHTGQVVVGEVSSGGRRELLALGGTTNVAARLQGQAEPDAVVLSAATLRLVAGVFVINDLGERQLKGVSGGTHVFEAVRVAGVRSRLEVSATKGLTPLVGRSMELGTLTDRWEQVCDGVGQVVLVGGEPGIGKSRVVHSFRESMAEVPHTWLECSCSPYATSSPFAPVLELHRQAFNLGSDALPAQWLDAIEAGLSAAEFNLNENVPLVAAMHNLDVSGRYRFLELSPEQVRRRTLDLMTEWLLRLAAVQPLVLLIEDLHWIDPSTNELLARVVEQAPRAELLVLLTRRPEYQADWETRAEVTTLTVGRLTRRQLTGLVRGVNGSEAIPDSTVEVIVARSDGVALFAEELTVAAIAAESTADRVIPDTLQDSLMGRLDALSDAKTLAQIAAVIGREADHEMLTWVWPRDEASLQRAIEVAVERQVLHRRGTAPNATYQFRHALLRDVAYDSMLRADREAHHLRVAEALVSHQPAVAESRPELVAQHLGAAGAYTEAIEWWRKAISRADGNRAYDEALAYIVRSVEVAEKVADDRDRTALELESLRAALLQKVRGWGHPDTRASIDRFQNLADRLNDPVATMRSYWFTVTSAITTGDYRGALEIADAAARLVDFVEDRTPMSAIRLNVGLANLHLGDLTSARQAIQEGMALDTTTILDERFGLDVQIDPIIAGGWLGWTLWIMGYSTQARTASRDATESARAFGEPFNLAYCLTWYANCERLCGSWEGALALGEEALHLVEEHALSLALGAVTRSIMASTLALMGNGSEVDVLRATIQDLGRAGTTGSVSFAFAALAEAEAANGRWTDAIESTTLGMTLSDSIGERVMYPELQRLHAAAVFATQPDDPAPVEGEIRHALALAHEMDAKSLELRAATSLARLLQDQSRCEEARALLASVYEWFTEGHDTRDLREAAALLDELR